MRYRALGKDGPKVSLLGVGCRSFGRETTDPKEIDGVVNKALDVGVNFFDTADVYGNGRSEELLARCLRGKPRDSYLIATKGGTERIGPGKERQNCDPVYLRRSLEDSLRRLNTDYIDLYQLHNPDPAVPLVFAAEAFARFIEEGKVRFIGVSNMTAGELYEWLKFLPETVSIQLPYSVLDFRRAKSVLNDPRILSVRKSGIAVSLIPWAPLFAGFVTDPPSIEKEKRKGLWAEFSDEFVEKGIGVVNILDRIAREHRVPIAAVALRFVMQNPDVATVPVGVTKAEHLEANLAALELTLTESESRALSDAIDRMPDPEIIFTTQVSQVLQGGTVAVLPMGFKVKVKKTVGVGDQVTLNLWDGTIKE